MTSEASSESGKTFAVHKTRSSWLGWLVFLGLLGAFVARALFAPSWDGSEHLVANRVPATIAFVIALVAAAWALRRQLEELAPLWVAALVFPTTVGAAVLEGRIEVVWMATTALALVLIFGIEHVGASRLPDLYERDAFDEQRATALVRWLLVGALLALPLASAPIYLPLLVAAFFCVPELNRRPSVAAIVLGAALGSAAMIYFSSGFGALGQLLTEELFQDAILDPRLLLWTAIDLAVGRHIGLLCAFFPIVLSLAAYRREPRRRAFLAAVGFCLLAVLFLDPLNAWGGTVDTERITNFFFLPLLPVFWFLAARRDEVNKSVVAVVSLLGLVVAGPLWIKAWLSPGPEGAWPIPPNAVARLERVIDRLEQARTYLPTETTQATLWPWSGDDAITDDVLVRRVELPIAIAPAASHRLAPGRASVFLVGAPDDVENLLVDLGPGGPSRLDVGRGEISQIAFRPDGGTSFQVVVPATRIRHRGWWSDGTKRFFVLRLRGRGEAQPTSVSVRPGVLLPNESGVQGP